MQHEKNRSCLLRSIIVYAGNLEDVYCSLYYLVKITRDIFRYTYS